jgi:hypothetical protein
MRDTKIIIVFVLILLVVLSGCGKKAVEDKKIKDQILEKFAFEPKEVFSKDLAFLEIELKNRADFDLEDTKIMIYNPPFGNCNGCWKIESVFPSCTGLGNIWSCLGTIKAREREFGTEGESRSSRWSLRAPEISENIPQKYDFFARVHYRYKTVATSEIVLVSRQGFTGSLNKTSLVVKNSDSPVKFSILSQSPILVNDKSDIISLCIRAEKTGSEVVYKPDVLPENFRDEVKDIIRVEVTLSGTNQMKAEEMNLNQTKCFEFSAGEVGIRKTLPVFIKGIYRVFKDFSQEVAVK